MKEICQTSGMPKEGSRCPESNADKTSAKRPNSPELVTAESPSSIFRLCHLVKITLLSLDELRIVGDL